jgi:hypothetical protein
VSVFYLGTSRRPGQSRMVRKHQQIHSLYHRANRMVKADPDFRRMAEFHRGLARKQALSDGSTLTAWIERRARAGWDRTNGDA